jgi:hypothetical protein
MSYSADYKTSEGRPPKIIPMQSWRRKPQFSKKRGRKPAQNAKNSLFPVTMRAQRWRQREKKKALAQTKKKLVPLLSPLSATISLGAAPLSFLAAAPLNANTLVTEDLSIHSLDFSRWDNPGYKLRIEEMETFISLLNASKEAQEQGYLFMLSQRRGLSKSLQNLWRTPGFSPTPDEVNFSKNTHRIDLISSTCYSFVRMAWISWPTY